MYFKVFSVSPAMKTRFAALNFSGAASSWLHSVESKGRVAEWEKLCELVFERFDRNQYQTHMSQLDSLRQTGSVDEYYTKFVDLSHHILLYNPAYDHVFFVNRFLGGLKDEICSTILLHHPKDVETASCLALLQEAELESVKTKATNKFEAGSSSRAFLKSGSSHDKSK